MADPVAVAVGQVWGEMELVGSVHRQIRITEVYDEYQALTAADIKWAKCVVLQGQGVGQIYRIRVMRLFEAWTLTVGGSLRDELVAAHERGDTVERRRLLQIGVRYGVTYRELAGVLGLSLSTVHVAAGKPPAIHALPSALELPASTWAVS